MIKAIIFGVIFFLIATFPATWLLMLFLGNVGLAQSYWGTLPDRHPRLRAARRRHAHPGSPSSIASRAACRGAARGRRRWYRSRRWGSCTPPRPRSIGWST